VGCQVSCIALAVKELVQEFTDRYQGQVVSAKDLDMH
jgi:hypothetical protein